MGNQELVVAFDIAEAGFKDWEFSAHGLIFIVVGLALWLVPKYFPVVWQLFDPSDSQKWMRKWFPRFFLGFALFWTIGAFAATYGSYRSSLSTYESGNFDVVEGVVERFDPMPKSGHQDESFTVDGVTFTYSDYQVVPGFNNTKSHGGPIDAGIYVRASYVNNTILRLEVEPSAMIGKERNHSKSLWDMSDDEDFSSRETNTKLEGFVPLFFMGAQILMVLSIAGNWWWAARKHLRTRPELKPGYARMFRQLVCWGTMPPLVGFTVYFLANGFVVDGTDDTYRLFYSILFAATVLYLAYWVFLKGGAQQVADYPGFVNYPWVMKLYTGLLLFWALSFSSSLLS